MSKTVKNVFEIYNASRRDGEDRLYLVWTLGRHLTRSKKSGRVSIFWLERYYCLATGKSEQSFRLLLKDGEGVWWKVGKNFVYLTGINSICDWLRVDRTKLQYVEIPIYAYCKLQLFRATLSSAAYTGAPQKREYLANTLGVSQTTTKNYTRMTKTESTKNVLLTSETGDPKRGFYTLNGQHYKRLPNSYRCPLVRRATFRRRTSAKYKDIRVEKKVGGFGVISNAQMWIVGSDDRLFRFS
jgi:hypothetical protein